MGISYKNFWSLNPDEAVTTGILRNYLKDEMGVFMPLDAQFKDIDLLVTNLKNKKSDIFPLIETLAKKNISIKILSRVDPAAMKNVEKMLALNFRHGKENVEIRHTEQPLRALISDGKLIRIKEIKEPTGRINELNKKTFIFYTIKDKSWVEWLSKLFWHIFSNPIFL